MYQNNKYQDSKYQDNYSSHDLMIEPRENTPADNYDSEECPNNPRFCMCEYHQSMRMEYGRQGD